MIGALREQLMLRFVFSVPGMPCIYYGDEAGVEGCADPFCRRTYPWGREDQDMLARYKAMAAMQMCIRERKYTTRKMVCQRGFEVF